MTEEEWFATLNPLALLDHLHGKPSWRKMRLASVACCRRMQHLLVDERSLRAIETAELSADKLLGKNDDLVSIEERASSIVNEGLELGHNPINDAAYCAAVCLAVWAPAEWGTRQVFQYSTPFVSRMEQLQILACVFAVPHRQRRLQLSFYPSWRTSDVMLLAQGIYDDRAFDRMPILADALQDAGCDCEDLLNHLRDISLTHVRGCWVLDLVLGKE